MDILWYNPTSTDAPLQLLRRRLSFRRTAPVRFHRRLGRSLVRLKLRDLGAIHVLHHLIGLPLLEAEAQPLVRVVLVVGLVLVVLDADEVGVLRLRVEREGDEGVDGGGLGDDLEGPGLEGVLARGGNS